MTPAIADEVVHLHILFSHGFEMAAQTSGEVFSSNLLQECTQIRKCLSFNLTR